ncbi:MAG: DUF4350 domain-containing protein [Acidimicrobiales bacterium]
MRGEARGAGIAIAVLVVLVLGMWLIGSPGGDAPLDPRSHRPSGTSGLVALLRELGATVQLDADVPSPSGPGDSPDPDVALVLRDRFDDDQRADLERWVRSGGVLVVVDPGSPLTPSIESGDPFIDDGDADDPVDDLGDDDEGFGFTVTQGPGVCDIGPLDDPDINQVDIYGGPVLYEVGADDQSCYGDPATAYVVATPAGDGTIVALGGSGIIVNRTLDDRDNAPVIAALLAPRSGTRVSVFDPTAPIPGEEGDETLWGLVPTGVYRGLAQLGVAFVVYVVWRVRRLGRPVAEPQPVKVAGSELVAAVGGLLERAKSPQHAADVLRLDLRRDLSVHLGLASNLRPETLAGIVAERTTLDAARLQAALGPGPVTTDADLVAVAQLIEIVRQEVLDHVGT